MKKRIARYASRQEKVAGLYERLYEDNAEGKVADEWYLHMTHKYEVERMELNSRAAELQEKLRSIGEMKQNKDSFLAAIRKFMQMETLTAPIFRGLYCAAGYGVPGKSQGKHPQGVDLEYQTT